MTHLTRRLGALVALAAGVLLTVLGIASGLPAGAAKTGMVCAPGNSGATHTFNLVAGTGYAQTPESNSIQMWSYADAGDANLGLRGFQYPGPVLCVTQGETVVVNLTNYLPEASSIVFPGQDSAVTASGGIAPVPGLGLTREATAGGGTVSYSFTASNPGTYLYESGSNVSKQLEMGLYGALIVRPNTTNCPVVAGTDCAYDAATRFDPTREYMLLLSEIDPDLHHAVETGGTYDVTKLHNHYYMINGRAFPDTVQDNGSTLLPKQPYGALVRMQPNTVSNNQPVLIRMLNAGAENHPFHPHGNHTREIAQDGRRILSPGGADASTEHFGETIGSGQTEDYLLRWDNQADNWDPVSMPFPAGTIPNYLNVTFKDANTWYSGSPYLGYKGTLPTGTNSLNICGEWYFPLHSHALNEFANFDEPFGGMGTLLRVDPAGGCRTTSTSATVVGGVVKSGTGTALAASDNTYFQVNPKTTTRTSATTIGQTSITVASAAGFPSSGSYYIRIDNEVLQVTGGQGTTTWTVARGTLGTGAATHNNGATVTALANDWYATLNGVPAGALNLKVTYEGKNCANTTGTACTAIAAPTPQQTVMICNWVINPTSGCSTGTSNGWVALPAPQGQNVGSTDVSTTWTLSGPASASTTLAGAITSAQLSVVVGSNAGFPAAPYFIRIGNEALGVTAKSGPGSTTWTVTRGQLGTTAASHVNASVVQGPNYVGTGTSKGQVRVLVHTERWTASNPTPFSTWGDFVQLVYDAP